MSDNRIEKIAARRRETDPAPRSNGADVDWAAAMVEYVTAAGLLVVDPEAASTVDAVAAELMRQSRRTVGDILGLQDPDRIDEWDAASGPDRDMARAKARAVIAALRVSTPTTAG